MKDLREVHKELIRLRVNGETSEVYVPVHKTLLEVLREDLNLTGTKHGCELGECGTCTVLVDGEPVLSCLALPIELQDREILTVEGLAERGVPHPLQVAFAELGAAQCGYCTPGILMAAKALLDENVRPTQDEIKEALAGNLCRCTGYVKIIEAVALAADRLSPHHNPLPGGAGETDEEVPSPLRRSHRFVDPFPGWIQGSKRNPLSVPKERAKA